MLRISESTIFRSLVGLLTASFLVALAGLCVQIAWLGQPIGWEAGWVGDISATVYTAAMILTFVLAAARQDTRTPTKKAGSFHG